MSQYEDLLVDTLLDYGFSVEEALAIIALQERVARKRRAIMQQHRLLARYQGLSHPNDLLN